MSEYATGDIVEIVAPFPGAGLEKGQKAVLGKKGEWEDHWWDISGKCLGDDSHFKLYKPENKETPTTNDSASQPQQEWNGEGKPPVGTECEYKDYEELVWRKCEILAHKGKEVVFWDLTYGHANNYQETKSFRPIKPEPAERDKAVDKMLSHLYINEFISNELTPQELIKTAFEILHDAGYHNGSKVNALTDEKLEQGIRDMSPSGLLCQNRLEGAKWARDRIFKKSDKR